MKEKRMTMQWWSTAGLVIVAILSIGITRVYAADVQALFDRGKAAMAREDYLEAAEALFAYQELDRELLEQHPDFRRRVEENLKHAEDRIRIALQTTRDLQNQGNVVAVEIESGGKFDAPNAPKTTSTKPFRPRSPPPPPARSLGNRPQQTAKIAPYLTEQLKPAVIGKVQEGVPEFQERLRTTEDADLRRKNDQLATEIANLKKRYVLLEERCARIKRECSQMRRELDRR